MGNLEGSRRGTPSPQGSLSMRGSFSEHLQSSWYQVCQSDKTTILGPQGIMQIMCPPVI